MIPISELDLIKIGEIIKAHGYKGELVIKLTVDFNKLKKTELLFFEINKNMVPFFFAIPPKPYKKSGMLVKFENLDSDNDVEEILYSSVYTPKKYLEEEDSSLSEIFVNYEVFDKDIFIGKVVEYLKIPSNPILSVITDNNREVLIPIQEEFIISVNDEKRKIVFNLPDGLTEIN